MRPAGDRTTFRHSFSLPGHSRSKTALLVFPPVYDTQYWSEWSQPYGLLRIAALLKKHNYKKIWFYDFMEPDARTGTFRIIESILCENYAELNQPQEKIAPIVIEKGSGERPTL